jgi:hypothetical protein
MVYFARGATSKGLEAGASAVLAPRPSSASHMGSCPPAGRIAFSRFAIHADPLTGAWERLE